MSAFFDAAVDIAADPHLGVDAIYTPPGIGATPVSLRIVPHQPEAPFGGQDAPRSVARSTEAMIPAASLSGRPAAKGRLTFGGADYVIEDVEADARGASYLVRLRRA